MDIGCFLDTDYHRRILLEILKINGTEIFNRSEKLIVGSLNGIQEHLASAYNENADSVKVIAESTLNDEELFLVNGFKVMFSSTLVSTISEWFEKKFKTICRANDLYTTPEITTPNDHVQINPILTSAAKQLGVNSNTIDYVIDRDEDHPELFSFFEDKIKGELKGIPATVFESYGTIRFINLFPLLANALLIGATPVIDEFDASIHPMALMSIVNVFHNDDININRAQLIFNTHNPIFLNSNLFRRDEIKFVERDDDTHASTHYSLSDFGTTGESSARKGGDYMKNYFVSRYGAIRNVDFTPVFESVIKGKVE
jgi:AAA15 family ATPase/GTPase